MSVARNDQPPSPCTDACVIDPVTGYCEGCFRELDEIADWSVMDGDEKRSVLAAIVERRARSQR